MKQERSFKYTDRYEFDFKRCTPKLGYSQIDTEQDAPYFGTWANPFKRIIVQYLEGDIIKTFCDNDEEFVEEVKKIFEWNRRMGYVNFGIDSMLDCDLEERWKALGLANFLH